MEIIDFKAGAQVAGTIVRDMYGVLWTVLKNIANATAQPREGAYYTRYLEPVAPAIDYKELYDRLSARVTEMEKNEDVVIMIDFTPHPDDFYIEEQIINEIKVQRLRIRR